MGLMFQSGGADTVGGSGGFGGGGGFWDALGSIGNTVAGIYATKAQNKQLRQMQRLAMPRFPQQQGLGFLQGVPAASGGLGAFGAGALGGALGSLLPSLGGMTDVLPGGLEESGTGVFGPDLFAPTRASARQRMIDAVHPGTGERVFWRPVGRPIMFAGDAALLRRTRKLARKLNAGCGAGRATFRRRTGAHRH